MRRHSRWGRALFALGISTLNPHGYGMLFSRCSRGRGLVLFLHDLAPSFSVASGTRQQVQAGAGRCDPPKTGRYSGTPGRGRDDTATDLTSTPSWSSSSPLFPLQVHPCTTANCYCDYAAQPTATTHLPFDSFFFPSSQTEPQEVANLNADWTPLSPLLLSSFPSSLSQFSTMTLQFLRLRFPPPLFGHLPEKCQLPVEPVHNASCLHFSLPNLPAKSFTVSLSLMLKFSKLIKSQVLNTSSIWGSKLSTPLRESKDSNTGLPISALASLP